jgi:hypothetical protein
MNLQRRAMGLLMGIVAGGIGAIVTMGPVLTQTNQAATFDPLATYIGTWVATNPNESTPFLILKLTEKRGKLSGTMSHFTLGVVRKGQFTWSPLTDAETPISDFNVTDSSLWFAWSGDAPFARLTDEVRGRGHECCLH